MPQKSRGIRRRTPLEELAARVRKLFGRVGKSLEWDATERERWSNRLDAALSEGGAASGRLGDQLFRLAGRIKGPVSILEARRLAAILRLIDDVPRAQGVEESLRVALTALRDGIEFENATGFLFEADQGRLVPSVVVGAHVDLIPDFSFDCGVGLSSWVAKTRKPVLLSTLRRDAEMPDTNRPSSFLSVPLMDGDQLVGVLNFAHRKAGAFTTADRDHLLLAAHFIVPKLRDESATPALLIESSPETLEIESRRHLEVRLQEEERSSNRSSHSFALVGLRLDLDTGADADEQICRTIDRVIARNGEEEATVCRLGPRMLGVILRHVTSQEAGRVASELRRELLNGTATDDSGPLVRVASVVYPRDAANANELLNRVESMLMGNTETLPNGTTLTAGIL